MKVKKIWCVKSASLQWEGEPDIWKARYKADGMCNNHHLYVLFYIFAWFSFWILRKKQLKFQYMIIKKNRMQEKLRLVTLNPNAYMIRWRCHHPGACVHGRSFLPTTWHPMPFTSMMTLEVARRDLDYMKASILQRQDVWSHINSKKNARNDWNMKEAWCYEQNIRIGFWANWYAENCSKWHGEEESGRTSWKDLIQVTAPSGSMQQSDDHRNFENFTLMKERGRYVG